MTYNPLIKQANTSSVYLNGNMRLSGNLTVQNPNSSISDYAFLGNSGSDIIDINVRSMQISTILRAFSDVSASKIITIPTGRVGLYSDVSVNNFSGSDISYFNYCKVQNKTFKQSYVNSLDEYPQTLFSSSTARIYTNTSTDYLTQQDKTYFVKATILAQEQRKINNSYFVGNTSFANTMVLKDDYLFAGSNESLSLFISGNNGYQRISASTTQLELRPPNSVNISIRRRFSVDALCVSGNYLFGNGQNNSSTTNYNGAVHIFTSGATGWQYETYISSTAASPTTGAYFGTAIASYGGYIFVGEPYKTGSNSAGNVYVYQSSSVGWSVAQTITSSNKKAGDEFGNKILYHNNQLFIGAPKANGFAENTGLIYIFNSGTTGWYESQKISGSNIIISGSNYGDYSSELTVCENTLIVGAIGSSNPARRGYIYLYKSSSNSGWQETQYVTGAGIASLFGRSAYITGNVMFVGTFLSTNRGAAYYYTSGSSGWVLTNLTGTINYLSINKTNDNFANIITGSKNSLIIAAAREYVFKNNDDYLIYQGAIYNYVSQSNGNWTLAGDTNSAVFVKTAKYKNTNGVITISDINTEYEYKDLPELNVNLTSTGSYIAIDVTGSADRNFYWHGSLEVQEI